jgi:DNA-binding beta-propeller fold protein YncE
MVNPPEVVERGRLLVAATRPLGSGDWPYAGPGTAAVAATFLDPRTGEVVEEFPVGETDEDYSWGASVAVSDDGRWIAVTTFSATYVIDSRTRRVIATIDLTSDGDEDGDGAEEMSGSTSAAWTKDGARLLLGNEGAAAAWTGDQDSTPGGDIVVVDTATWKEVDRVAIGVVPEHIELDPSGRFLVAVSPLSAESQILDADRLEVLDGFSVGFDRLVDVAFSPDGRLLAGAGINGGLHIIDTRTWDAREPVLMRDSSLLQVEWLPDNRTVVVAADDGSISLFDAERLLARAGPLPASAGGEWGFTKVLPDPDDEIVAINAPHPALRYSMDPAVWLAEACAIVARDLTRAEWDRYLPGREYRPTCSDLP